MMAEPMQRLTGLQMALGIVNEGMLWLICQRLDLQPRCGRKRGQLANWLFREACRHPRLAQRLAAELTPCLLPGYRPGSPPEPQQVVSLLKRSRRKGLALGLLWAMGDTLDDPAWAAAWNRWLKDSADWRRRLEQYMALLNDQETVQVAQSIVTEAEARRDRMRQALVRMARSCREEMKRLQETIATLEEVNRQLAALRPLQNTRILVVGDPNHAGGYQQVVNRYGGDMVFADGTSRQGVRKALDGRYDAIVVVTAYGYHTTQMMIQKHAPEVPLFSARRGGLGEMERVLVTQVIPALFKRLRSLDEPASA